MQSASGESQYFFLEQLDPRDMDVVLAEGWRHFGSFFFKDTINEFDGKKYHVIPLRINLEKFDYSKNHKKILRKNSEIEVIFREACVDTEKENLFFKHIQRFKHNVPTSLYDFLDENTAHVPCLTLECCLYDNGKLYAASFFDVGKESTSSIYAMFDPEYENKSPGIQTLLEEIKFAQNNDKKYLYTGYAHIENSFYDYKKKFKGSEYFDWNGQWKNLDDLLKEV